MRARALAPRIRADIARELVLLSGPRQSGKTDRQVSPHLLYLRRKFPAVDAVQVIQQSGFDRRTDDGVRLVSADIFLRELET